MMRIGRTILALGLALCLAVIGGAPLMAQTGGDKHEGHDHAKGGHDLDAHHGGLVQEFGDRHGELVIDGGKLLLFLADHDGKHLAPAGFKAEALVLAGSERRGPYALAPAEEGLKGEAPAPGKGSKVVVTLTDPSGKATQARFEIK